MRHIFLMPLAALCAVQAFAAAKVEVTVAEVRPIGSNIGSRNALGSGAQSLRANLLSTVSPVTGIGNGLTLTPNATLRVADAALLAAPPVLNAAAVVMPADAPRPAAVETPGVARAAEAPITRDSLGVARQVADEAASSAGANGPVESGVTLGTIHFDGARGMGAASLDAVGGGWRSRFSRLGRATPSRSPDAAPRRDLRDLANEAADIGYLAAGWQIFAYLLSLAASGHPAYPVLVGLLWTLGASEMIKRLAHLRGRVVGGWQAPHDQKMRHDYGTGKLIDIRGHAYGTDRYDAWAPGPTTGRSRAIIDAVAVLSGLPWIIAGGLDAIALYLLTALTLIAARRLRDARRPSVPADDGRPVEYDR